VNRRAWIAAGLGGVVVVGAAIGFALSRGEITSALTLLGALVVASVTAWAAEQRLTRQLAAASDRHERELAHDREQREADRAHDRALADLGDLRRIVDDVMVVLMRCEQSIKILHAAHRFVRNVEAEPEIDAAPMKRLLREQPTETRALVRALSAECARLRVRVGPDDPLVASVRAALNSAFDACAHAHSVDGALALAAAVTQFGDDADRAKELAVERTGTADLITR
jgi:hypothetical protein